MAGIKAGTAYIQIEMSGVRDLRKAMNDEVTSAATSAADKATATLSKNTSGKGAAAKVASDLKNDLSASVSSSIAPATMKMADMFNLAGASSAERFLTQLTHGIGSGVGRAADSVSGAFSAIRAGAASAGSAIASGFSSAVTFIGNASKALRDFSAQIGIASRQLQAMGVIGSIAFTAPVVGVGILGAAIGINFAVQVEDATVALKALLPKGYDVVALIKRLQALAVASPVFDTAAVITFTQQMAAAGISVDKTEKFLKAFGNIAVTARAPMDKITLALQAFTQMAGKGKVQMEELRQQLGDALPGALKIAADGLGITQAKLNELTKEGKITADQIIDAFIKVGNSSVYLEGASTGAETLRSRWNALKESIQVRLGNAVLQNMDQIKAAFDRVTPIIQRFVDLFIRNFPGMVDFVGQLADRLSKLLQWYDGLSDKNKDLIKKFIEILVIGGPILAILGTLGTAAAGVAAGISVLASTAGLVALAIGAVIAGAILLYNWLKNLYNGSEGFRNKINEIVSTFNKDLLPVIKQVASEFKESLMKAWDQLSSSVKKVMADSEGLRTLLQAIGAVLVVLVGIILGVVVGAIKALGFIIQGLVSFISGGIQVINGLLNFLYDLFSGNFKKLDADVKAIWNGLWDAVVGTFVNFVRALAGFVSGFVETVIGFFRHMYEVLVGHSIVPDMINAIIDWFTQLPGKIAGILAGLIQSGINKFIELKNSVVSLISELVNSAVSRFQSIVGAFASIASAVRDRVSDVISFAASLPGRVLGVLSGLGSLLYGAGQDLVRGLLNGLSSMAGSVIDRARGIANSVKSTIADALRIGSPSKVMMELGQFTMEGFAIGLQKDISDVRGVMADTVRAIRSPIASMAPVVNVNTADANRAATLSIENYYAPEDASPEKQAEAFGFIIRTRGW